MLRSNILIGIIGSVWIAIIQIAVIPVYISVLGIEAYGLIALHVTLQGVLQTLDLGLSPAVNRAVARNIATGKSAKSGVLVYSLQYIYGAIAILIGVVFWFVAHNYAEQWINAEVLSKETIRNSFVIMGFVIAVRWPIALFQSVLIGAQKLAIASYANVLMTTLSALGAIVVINFISSTLTAFFIYHLLIGCLHMLTMYWLAWRVLGKVEMKYNSNVFKDIWKFSLGAGVIAMSSLAFTQLDKLVLSKMLGIKDLGIYMLGAVISGSLYVLIRPIFNVIYPKLTGYLESNSSTELLVLYKNGTQLLSVILFTVAFTVTVYSEQILLTWTGDQHLSTLAAPVVGFLILGSALHGVMHFPFALQLAHGNTKIAVFINTLLIVIVIPLLITLISILGLVGAALAWFFSQVIYMLLGTWMTHRIMLPGEGISWIIKDVLLPLMLTGVLVYVSSVIILSNTNNIYTQIIFAVSTIGIVPIFLIGVIPSLRNSAKMIQIWT